MKFKERGIVVAKSIAAGVLFGALGRQPYAYYTLLRWVVCAVAAYAAFRASVSGKVGWVWVLGIVALLFNPIIPVHLNREVWAFVDVVVVGILLASIFGVDRLPSARDEGFHRTVEEDRTK